MSKSIRTGCIKTNLHNNGRFSHYSCTLPIPRVFAESINFEDCQCIKGKYYFCKLNIDFDNLWYAINKIQVAVANHKIIVLTEKRDLAFNRATTYLANNRN